MRIRLMAGALTGNSARGGMCRQRDPYRNVGRAGCRTENVIEEGGVDRTTLAAEDYADTKPEESNETEAGKIANRRIEIVLYPKDLSDIAGHMK